MRPIRTAIRILFAALLVCLCVGLAAVRAAGSCSLRVTVEDEQGTAVRGINVELLYVAAVHGGQAALQPDFADLSLTAAQLMADGGPEQAEAVYQYVSAMELEGTVKTTASNGSAGFSGLAEGIYLVFERGQQHVSFEPYLVRLPAEINGSLHSAVTSVPKTSGTDTRTLWVQVFWEDDMNAAGRRPKAVEVSVLRDGVAVRKVTLSDANYWQHMFFRLPDSGEYTVKQKTVSRYTTEYEPVIEGFIIINTYKGSAPGPGGGGGGGTTPTAKAHVNVRKVWDDQDDQAMQRPASVTVQLIGGGTVLSTAVLNDTNHWEHTFTDLDGSKSYTVREIGVDWYRATYAGNASTGITVTNHHLSPTPPGPGTQPDPGTDPDPGTEPDPVVPQPGQVDIPVRVTWQGDEHAPEARPQQVTVRLVSGGSIVGSLVLDASNGWQGVFAQVPADLSYTVWQGAVTDYTTTYSGSASEGFLVDNAYTKGVTGPGTLPDPTPADPDPAEPEDPTVDPGQKPDKPTIPQTGHILWPTWLLLAAGALLVVLGLWDVNRGRKRDEA